MEAQVNLNVNFNGQMQNFHVSDPQNTTWADVEAMVKVSFDLKNIQIKYLDEDNEEVFVNSQEEYEEALKIAVKQGGDIQINVYEITPYSFEPHHPSRQKSCENVTEVKLSSLKKGKKHVAHYSPLAKAVRQDLKSKRETTEKLLETPFEVEKTNEKPPDWFTCYMEKFKKEVVKETMEKLCEKLILPNPLWDTSSNSMAVAIQVPEKESVQSGPHEWMLSCSNCQTKITGIRYQCSLCPAYSLCEFCEVEGSSHDPNHVFLKLRKPVHFISENNSLGQISLPRISASVEQVRLQKQMDRAFIKAEKQRLRAEKKQRKAKVKELKQLLKVHRKISCWNPVHGAECAAPAEAKPDCLQSNVLVIPMQPCTAVVPTLSAVFVDENLPDGTHLQPGTKFIKHWRMKNTGNVKWSCDTKLKFMWGNLTLLSSANKDVSVPSLLPGEIGILSVEFIAPALEGTYTSHWRLAHSGEQFGPRVWCSIIVDPFPCVDGLETSDKTLFSSTKMSIPHCKPEQEEVSVESGTNAQNGEAYQQPELPAIPFKIRSVHRESAMYLPSVDLLTAQDLLSFELLDINIVQEMERVPHNTPVDMTPCMSPLPHDSNLIEKPGLGQIDEENEGVGLKVLSDVSMVKVKIENTQEEGEEDISSTQFVCETVMRSLTLDAAPDHKPPQRKKDLHSSLQTLSDSFSYSVKCEGPHSKPITVLKSSELQEESCAPYADDKVVLESENNEACCGLYVGGKDADKPSEDLDEDNEDNDDNVKDEVQSQGSSASSEDYFIILPECFDTSRPLVESMYSSAMSQSEIEKVGESEQDSADTDKSKISSEVHNINDILTTSQILDAIPLIPQVISPSPQLLSNPVEQQNGSQSGYELDGSGSLIHQIKEEPTDDYLNEPPGLVKPKPHEHSRHHGSSIAGGLVKGALSVAASAYKALFSGQPVPAQPTGSEDQSATMIAILFEMGFCDRQLNQRLLKKHNYNLMEVVTELIQINDNDWYASRY
ncbi:next to BRCA1 gene 1 protein isoform X2 [Ambystoma mexicanum]|uniref:next to BRCA1 gene 1 protein isoform X2 n=1 Tax=Ambystoma mexicanum TaxID=8296 RepID=UPI0037E8B2CA